MFIRKAVFCASIALGVIAVPAAAQIGFSIEVAPPPPRYEVVPSARAGYVWAPGYWRWEEPRRTHVWVDGRWEAERPGHRWVEDRWVERDRRHYYEPGRWERYDR
jgi:hypothetical protein